GAQGLRRARLGGVPGARARDREQAPRREGGGRREEGRAEEAAARLRRLVEGDLRAARDEPAGAAPVALPDRSRDARALPAARDRRARARQRLPAADRAREPLARAARAQARAAPRG